MKRIPIVFVIALVGINSGCRMSRESPFFAKFSMRDLVTSNKSFSGFHCDSAGGGGGGGGGSIWSSSGRFGGKINFQSHKSDAFECRLQSDELTSANEERLIGALRQQVEDSLRAFGATIKDGGSREPRSFYLSYTIEDIQGRVQVSGKRVGVDYYSLQAELEEANK